MCIYEGSRRRRRRSFASTRICIAHVSVESDCTTYFNVRRLTEPLKLVSRGKTIRLSSCTHSSFSMEIVWKRLSFAFFKYALSRVCIFSQKDSVVPISPGEIVLVYVWVLRPTCSRISSFFKEI